MADTVWIRTDPDITGTYRPVLEIDDDTSLHLNTQTAAAYASEILRAVAIAEYEAAVYAQLMKAGHQDQDAVAHSIAHLRADRPQLDTRTPLRLIPGVSAFTGEAFLAVEIKGRQVGQWSPADARKHALFCMEAVHVADLDSAYLRWLRTHPKLEEPTARVVVGDLVNFRAEG